MRLVAFDYDSRQDLSLPCCKGGFSASRQAGQDDQDWLRCRVWRFQDGSDPADGVAQVIRVHFTIISRGGSQQLDKLGSAVSSIGEFWYNIWAP
jgi:hypothetical protein